MISETTSRSGRSIYPWIIVFLCSGLLFYKYILNVSLSIMVTDLMRQFKVSGGELGNLAATFFYIYTITQIFSGVILDKVGARFIAGFSTLFAALGAFLFAHTQTLWFATLARGMMGFGVAFATVTYFKLTVNWFKTDQLAFVGGLAATASMIGAVCGQAPLAWMLSHTNWHFVLKFCAFLGLVIGVLFLLFVRNQPAQTVHSPAVNSECEKVGWSEVKATLGKSSNWLITLYSGLAFAPLIAIGGLWGTPFLKTVHHLSTTHAAELNSLLFIGLGIGAPVFGLLSDRLEARVVVMKYALLCSFFALSAVMYVSYMGIWLSGIVLFAFGFFTGAFMLGFTLGTEINPLLLAGTIVAMINTGDSLCVSITEPLIGKILDISWNGQMQAGVRYFTVHDYQWGFAPLLLYFVLAFVMLCFVREKRHS